MRLHPADNDDGGEDGQDNAGVQGIQSSEGLHRAGDLGGLGNVADAEAGDTAQQGEEDGQPLLACALLNVVHGAAVVGALLVYLTVFHGQHDLSVLGHHAKEGGNPHPEHRAGTADKDGAGDAGNVAGTHRAGPER